jgi:hypothetical protein
VHLPCHVTLLCGICGELVCAQAMLCHGVSHPAAAFRYSAGSLANILWSAGVKDKSEVGEVIGRLEAAGMPTLDISGMDAARVSGGWGCGCLAGSDPHTKAAAQPAEICQRVLIPCKPVRLRRSLAPHSANGGRAGRVTRLTDWFVAHV